MNYIQLTPFEKKMYRVHKGIFASQTNDHVIEVAQYLETHESSALGEGLRVACAGEMRRRKLAVD